MAFNPFHAFRKHQKVVFAALTIICMLTFVLASGVSGKGDFFGEIQRMVSGGRSGLDVAGMDGERFDAHQLLLLRQQRNLANQYMKQRIFLAHSNLIAEFLDPKTGEVKVDEFDASIRDDIQRYLPAMFAARMNAFNPPPNFPAQYIPYFQQNYLSNLPQYVSELSSVLRLAKRSNDADRIRDLRDVMNQEGWLLQSPYLGSPKDELYPHADLYFGGDVSTTEGLVDFMLWRREADRLTIHLTEQDVFAMVQKETAGHLSDEQSRALQRNLLENLRLPAQSLYSALADEFRVRLAQTALVGYDPAGIGQTPALISPDDYWQYFKRNRTSLNVELLPVPVSKFVAQVKDTPTEDELEKLFNEYKEAEWAPDKDTPGFKQPRRVQVQWVEASPQASPYRKAAVRVSQVLQATVPWAWQANLWNEYKSVRFQSPIGGWTEAEMAPSFYTYGAMRRPADVAGLWAAGGTPASLAPWVVLGQQGTGVAHGVKDKELAAAMEREAKQHLLHGSQVLTAGLGLNSWGFAGLWNYSDNQERYLPLDVVKLELVQRIEQSVAGKLVENSLTAFGKGLDERKSKSPEEIRKYVQDEVKSHEWKQGGMDRLADEHAIQRDAKRLGLGPLREAYGQEMPTDRKGKYFARRFFYENPARLYNLEKMPVEKTTFAYWKTVDQPAKVLSFAEARPQVEEAWRFARARELARKEADDIAAKAKGDPTPVLTEWAKKLDQKTEELFGIARMRQVPNPRMGFGMHYEPYRVDEDKIEYPPVDFVDQVLMLKNQGDTAVINDRPGAIYYVVAATSRPSVPTISEFHKEGAPSFLTGKNPLLEQMMAERRLDYRRAVLKDLRAQAKVWIDPSAKDRIDEKEKGQLQE
jgi:hypothetical protein